MLYQFYLYFAFNIIPRLEREKRDEVKEVGEKGNILQFNKIFVKIPH